jgi:tetratricopeptide (TPR) repeat protein
MAKRYFNWKLAIVLLMSFGVLIAMAFVIRQLQRGTRAERALTLGNEAYNEHNWDEAAKELGRYLVVHRDDVAVLLKYAESQLKRKPVKSGNIQQAIAAYRTILRLDASNSEAAKQLSEIYLMVNSPGETELIARRYIEVDKDPDLQRMLALSLASQRKYTEAAAELKSIIEEHPDQVMAYETLGKLTEQRPEDFTDQAEHWYNLAVQNNPSAALPYVIRAGFYLRNKERSKALADLEQAESQDLSDPSVLLRLAREYINANVMDKAEKYLQAVYAQTPKDQNLWRLWAQLALRSGSQEKMLKIANDGLEQLSSEPWDFMPIAVELFINSNQLDRAAECISELKDKDIAPAVVAHLEGVIAERRGQTYQAIQSWQKALEFGDRSPSVRLALASALVRLGDRQSALRHLRTLVSEYPDLFDARLALARLLARIGNWAETSEHARRAMQLAPENLEPILLDLNARIVLLTQSPATDNAAAWQAIEEQLSALDEVTEGALDVKLLQLRVAAAQENLTEVEAIIKQLKQEYPSSLRVILAEAELLVAQGKTEQAIALMTRATKEFPTVLEPARYLAVLLAGQGERQKCEATLRDAMERMDQPAILRDLGLLLADFYTRWQEPDKAYELLASLRQKLPGDIPIRRRLLICEQMSTNLELAQHIVDEIKSLEGEDGWHWRFAQASLWYNVDEFRQYYPQIVSLLQENLLTNPNDQASRLLLAATYDRAGELQLALAAYREAWSRSPDDINIIIPTVAALYKAEEYDEAENILNRVSQQKLYHPQLQRIQLRNYLRRGQLSSASEILEELISNDPNNQAACLSLALLKIQQNEFDGASQLLEALKAQHPNSLSVTSAQVQLSIRQGKQQEALHLCDELVENLKSASTYMLRAKIRATLGQRDGAIKDLKQATAMEPNNVGVWIASSDFYRATGHLDQAIADIRRALSLAPDNIQVQKRAIALFLRADNPDIVQQGIILHGKALESNPTDVELLLIKARMLLSEGTAPAIKNARDILQKVTDENPKNSRAWVLLGEIMLLQRQPGRAVDIALRGLAHTPNDKTLLLLKARAEAARSPILAVPTLRVLREQDPNNVDYVIRLANAYINDDQAQKAVDLLHEQITNSDASNMRRCRLTLAVALYKSGNKTEAQEEFDLLTESLPDDPAPLVAQARLLIEDKSWDQIREKVSQWYQTHPTDIGTPTTIANDLGATGDKQAQKVAEDILLMVLQREPNSRQAIAAMAMLLQVSGRGPESAELYRKVLEVEPNNVVAINNLAWVLCEDEGKLQEALTLANRGLKLAPQYLDLIDTRGVIYYRLGEYDKSVQDFKRCVELYLPTSPSSVASRFHLGRVYAQIGQKEQAVELISQALESDNDIGGLMPTDRAEARRILEQLQKGN